MITVIIPLAPDEDEWRDLLEQLKQAREVSEIILASCSAEEFSLPDDKRVKVVKGRSGRAGLMNVAADEASGSYLWFLHADSRLDEGAIGSLCHVLDQEPEVLHYFDLEFLSDGPKAMRLNSAAVKWRSDFLGMPFGDQGFCIKKELFHELGGYDEKAEYGEDHLFVWKARQEGVSVKPVGAIIFTSARKYRRNGWFKTTGLHVWFTLKQAAPEFLKLLKKRRS